MKLRRFLEMKMMWFLWATELKQFHLIKLLNFKDFHVFIPNFQEIGFKDSINKDTGYKFSYAKGFEKK